MTASALKPKRFETPNIRNNSLNFIRILAAFNVFYGHAIHHLQLDSISAVDKLIGIFQGVPIFFLLSGFLLWNSLAKGASFKTFCSKRLLRIYPELWFSVILNSIVIIVLYRESLSLLPFLIFNITQGTVLQFWTPQCLRGYGVGTPNGSLWTISVTVQSYFVIWILRKIMKKRNLLAWIIMLGLCVACDIVFPMLEPLYPNEILYKLSMQTFFPYLWLFLLGAFLNEYFDKCICFLMKYWFVFFAVSVFFAFTGQDIGAYSPLKILFLAPAIIGFCYRFNKIRIRYDLTYGFFLIHMVVINVMVELGFVNKNIYFFVACFLSLLIAAISYFTIGAFSRKQKAKIDNSSLSKKSIHDS